MHLYHLTALPATGGALLAYGSFSAPRAQEVVLGAGSRLALHRLTRAGALAAVGAADAFGCLRALARFRPAGARVDLLLVASDAGALAALRFDPAARAFVRVALDAFGRTGARRVVPGEFLAADPAGRACMVAAVERGKFAYVVARGPAGEAVLQSALEAHKSGVAVHALVGLDVGHENPVFAALEVAYDAADPRKRLVHYELDLGLNHVVRRLASPVEDGSFVLLPVPGAADGPGGVLVCSPGRITYRSLADEEERGEVVAAQDVSGGGGDGPTPAFTPLSADLPRREGGVGDDMVVCGAVHKHKDVFFFVVCSEAGDLFKVELDWAEEAGVATAVELRVLYFDSLPVPARALAIFRSGYLFAALESGDPLFLKFKATSVDEGDGGYSTSASVADVVARREAGDASAEGVGNGEEGGDGSGDAAMMDVGGEVDGGSGGGGGGGGAPGGAAPSILNAAGGDAAALAAVEAQMERRKEFMAREEMRYFTVVDVLESLAPSVAIAAGDFCGEGSGQLVCAGGRGRAATLRVLRRGFAVLEEMAQEMSAPISALFTLREGHADVHHRFIVVSFRDATKVLRVKDESVVEFVGSGLTGTAATLGVGLVGTSSFLQVYAAGARLVPGGRADAVTEWAPADGVTVLSVALNGAQAVLALSCGSVAYFDLSNAADVDSGAQPLAPTEMLADAVAAAAAAVVDGSILSPPALSLPDIPKGRTRASFFAVSDGQSSMVRLYQVSADGDVKSVGVHIAPAPVNSLALTDFGALTGSALASAESVAVSKKAGKSSSGEAAAAAAAAVPVEPMLCLVVGTRKGALVLLRVDPMTGAMSGKRSKFLGSRAVRVQRMTMSGVPCCFAMCVRPWLIHRQGARIVTSPLCTESMRHVASFSSELFPDGFVAASSSSLRFLSLESLPALTASAALPARLPASLVPADTVLGSTFFMSKSKLLCTPRRIAPVGFSGSTIVKEKENDAAPLSGEGTFVVLETEHRASLQMDYADERVVAKRRRKLGSALSLTSADVGVWASHIRLISIKQSDIEDETGAEQAAKDDSAEKSGEEGDEDEVVEEEDLYAQASVTLDSVALPDNDSCALALAILPNFGDATLQSPYVAISVGRNVKMSATSPSSASDRASGSVPASGELHVYRVNANTRKFEFVHTTLVDKPVHALVAFRNLLLVGIGTSLRLYDLGKKQLLRKSETRVVVANQICTLAVAGGDRVFAGDVQDSVTLLKYYPPTSQPSASALPIQARVNISASQSGRFVAIARDGLPRYLTNLLALDYSTVCGSDKFGNLFVLRLPVELSGAELSAVQSAPGRNDTLHRLGVEACFHIGSTVTGLTRGSLRGGTGSNSIDSDEDGDCVIYTTMSGAIGILAPFTSKSDVDLATRIEAQMRIHDPSLIGRSHVSYRSSFAPVRHVVDGDLCEMFVGLPRDTQVAIAEALERDLSDVLRKLDDFRNNSI